MDKALDLGSGSVHCRRGSRIWSGGGQQSFDPKGGLSPKCAQYRGFPLKIA